MPRAASGLNHKDYDGWRSIASPHLSNDGKLLAYGLFPQEGDAGKPIMLQGENLKTLRLADWTVAGL